MKTEGILVLPGHADGPGALMFAHNLISVLLVSFNYSVYCVSVWYERLVVTFQLH